MIEEYSDMLGYGPWLKLGNRYITVSKHNLQQLIEEREQLDAAIIEVKLYLERNNT